MPRTDLSALRRTGKNADKAVNQRRAGQISFQLGATMSGATSLAPFKFPDSSHCVRLPPVHPALCRTPRGFCSVDGVPEVDDIGQRSPTSAALVRDTALPRLPRGSARENPPSKNQAPGSRSSSHSHVELICRSSRFLQAGSLVPAPVCCARSRAHKSSRPE